VLDSVGGAKGSSLLEASRMEASVGAIQPVDETHRAEPHGLSSSLGMQAICKVPHRLTL